MPNATITGNSSGNGATISNATNGAGTPSQNGASVTVQTQSATVSGTGHFYDVNFLAGNDSLIATNMPWVDPASGDTLGFDNIDMGAGNDYVELNRSAFYRTLDMGDNDDTLIMNNSGGRDVLMGAGNDFTRLDSSEASLASEEELAQKSGTPGLDIDGGTGLDTLNLVGAWTLTLSSGQFSLDTDGNGSADTFTSILRSDQYDQVVGMPTLLSGEVQWGTTITLSDSSTVLAAATFSNFEALNAVCFTAGTLIDTPNGPQSIETLREGSMVNTRAGPRAIRWIGKRHLDVIDLMANPKLLPIRVPKGAFGPHKPCRDLLFSPQHRLVVASAIAEQMFGAPEVLISAKQLVGFNGIAVEGGTRAVWYWHVLLDHHAVVQVEGIEAETLYPGEQALRFLNADARAEVAAIFPEIYAEIAATPAPALPMLTGRDARALAARMIRQQGA